MRLHILSDLHLEFEPFEPHRVDADVVLLAGDIDLRRRGVEWARKQWPDRPVIYVPGNHEFYGHKCPKLIAELKTYGAELGIHVLDNDEVMVEGVRVLGATLWTDFALLGDRNGAKLVAADSMTDYRKIRVDTSGYRRLRPRDTAVWHSQSKRWLVGKLTQQSAVPTVVVTHHAPSARSLDSRHGGPIAASYASALDDVVAASGARIWVHGHTHHSVDYGLGSTRVLSNQRGYPDESATGFDPALVIEI